MNNFLKRIGLFSLLMIAVVAINRKSISAGLFKTTSQSRLNDVTGNNVDNNFLEWFKSKYEGAKDKVSKVFTFGQENAEDEARMSKLVTFAQTIATKVHDIVQAQRATLNFAKGEDKIMESIIMHAHKVCDAFESKSRRIVESIQDKYRGERDDEVTPTKETTTLNRNNKRAN